MGNNFAIKNYLDADKVTKELDALIKKPIYSIKPEALKKYERILRKEMCKVKGNDRHCQAENTRRRSA